MIWVYTQVNSSEARTFPFAAASRLQWGSAASLGQAASPVSVSSTNGPLHWEEAWPPGLLSDEALPIDDKPMFTFTTANFSHFLFAYVSVFPNSPVLLSFV